MGEVGWWVGLGGGWGWVVGGVGWEDKIGWWVRWGGVAERECKRVVKLWNWLKLYCIMVRRSVEVGGRSGMIT